MPSEKFESRKTTTTTSTSQDQSFGSAIREVSTSVKDLALSEVDLVKAEIKDSSRTLGKHSAQAAIFGALLSLSVLPFLAFLVIGLGNLLNGRYWLSSLLVAAVCALIGGSMTARAYSKIKSQDLSLPRSRLGLEHEKETVSGKIEDVKDTTTKRRAA